MVSSYYITRHRACCMLLRLLILLFAWQIGDGVVVEGARDSVLIGGGCVWMVRVQHQLSRGRWRYLLMDVSTACLISTYLAGQRSVVTLENHLIVPLLGWPNLVLDWDLSCRVRLYLLQCLRLNLKHVMSWTKNSTYPSLVCVISACSRDWHNLFVRTGTRTASSTGITVWESIDFVKWQNLKIEMNIKIYMYLLVSPISEA